jgi:hypothetical protein
MGFSAFKIIARLKSSCAGGVVPPPMAFHLANKVVCPFIGVLKLKAVPSAVAVQ